MWDIEICLDMCKCLPLSIQETTVLLCRRWCSRRLRPDARQKSEDCGSSLSQSFPSVESTVTVESRKEATETPPRGTHKPGWSLGTEVPPAPTSPLSLGKCFWSVREVCYGTGHGVSYR